MTEVNWRRLTAFVLLSVAVLGGACKNGGSSDKDAAKATTTSSSSSTTLSVAPPDVTSTTAVAGTGGVAVVKKSAEDTTATTTASTHTVGATVDDAPRDPVVEKSDTDGGFSWGGTERRQESGDRDRDENDPFSFGVDCTIDNDGHGLCKSELTNHVKRTAQFPDGLKITVTMKRDEGESVQFVFDPRNVSSLQPGETAFVEGSFDLTTPGHYSYSATTVVSWP
jgi:hypothetical protein